MLFDSTVLILLSVVHLCLWPTTSCAFDDSVLANFAMFVDRRCSVSLPVHEEKPTIYYEKNLKQITTEFVFFYIVKYVKL